MRTINYLVLHCTATPQTTTVASIDRYWRVEKKWKSPGYHYIILPDGTAINLHPIELPSNGVQGHNFDSIHISYIGGVDKKNNPLDNRTDAQKQTQIRLLKELKAKFPNAKILGHRDFGNTGKMCPSFDVADWLECIGLS